MLLPGSRILFEGQAFRLVEIKSLQHVLAEDSNGKRKTLPIDKLSVPAVESRRTGDLAALDTDDVQATLFALEALKLLAKAPKHHRSVEKVDEVAKLLNRSRSTIYRWLDRFETQASLSSLMRKQRNDIGVGRLPQVIEDIITWEIDNYYLTLNRPSIASTAENVRIKCKAKNLSAPDESSVRARIHRLDPALVELKRYGPKSAAENFDPIRGSFPNALTPLAVVQIDHTPMDVIIVDDKWRKPIGRPFLTLALDVCTKMVVGFYISLDHPGALATGLCLSHAILRKEAFLADLGLDDMQWPCWGKMRTVHSDNAKEFRGTMLGLACAEHAINPERRPKGQPKYGGNIERGFRTWMQKIHEELPGTTFSNVQQKLDYDAEGHAVMSLGALIHWFTLYLLGYYHQQPHEGNDGLPPIVKWDRLLREGTDELPPVGIPAPVDNPEQLRLDFMPCFERTIQEYGIQNWGLQWYADSLRRLIHIKSRDKPNEAKQFICRYDPRDLSRIWLWDDEARLYLEVPFRDKTRPPISLWEVKHAKKLLRDDSKNSTNEELIFQTVERMRKLVAQESELTKTARRQQQRQKAWEKAQKAGKKPASTPAPASSAVDDDDIAPFDDIREL
jgi:putative transposase